VVDVSLNFDALKFNWVIDNILPYIPENQQFYDFRYQFRAFGSRFEHFKVKKPAIMLIWAHCSHHVIERP
jgi:hypothetical protein